MTGCSTPKRPLEVNEDEDYGPNLKRLQHNIHAVVLSGTQSSSQSSYDEAINVQTPSGPVQEMIIDSDKMAIELPQRNCLPPLSELQSTFDNQLPKISSQLPDFQCADAGPYIQNAQKDEEVCFGRLRDIHIEITNSLKKLKNFEEIVKDQDNFIHLDLIFEQDRCNVQFKNISVATMNTKTHHALRSLQSKLRVRYEGLVTRVEFKEKLDSVMKPLGADISKLTWSMDIQIFGVRSIGDAVAKELSQYRLFLQHPYSVPFDVAYENPQYPSMLRSSFTNGAVLPPISIEASHRETKIHLHPEDLDDDVEELSAVINDLPRHDYLREVDIDKRIQTDLLRQVHQIEGDLYQKVGVDFAMGRELIEGKSWRMLWHADDLISGRSIYRHKITGAKSEEPSDMLGGILADDMGLGKTLTMIATIVATISRAEYFAARGFQDEKGAKAALIPVMSTLVVVPSVLLLNGWIDEVVKHVVPGTLKCYKYHGPDRRLGSSYPLPYHIVFSTYGTVAAELDGGVLNCFHWYRLILDEAHIVRNCSTKQFKAVASLSSAIRWCMTGTPVQNSLYDLGSLLKFLRVPLLDDTAAFRRYIAGKRGYSAGKQRLKPHYENLRLVLGSVCLRRNISALSLGFTFIEQRPHLSEVERRAYDDLAVSCKRSIDAVVSDRRAQQGNRAILTALLRLRIFCNTGFTNMKVTEMNSEEQFYPDEVNSLLQQSSEAVCVVCNSDILSFETIDELDQIVNPDHPLKCQECVAQGAASHDSGCSSGGRSSPIHDADSQNTLLQREYSGPHRLDFESRTSIPDNFTYSSKLKALLSDIREHYAQDKSIVFSFWKRSLDLVARLLHENNIAFGQVDGTLSPYRRNEVLAKFHNDRSVRVLLITLGIGAIGLNNLSVASRVHILEPQWNPSVEDQAIGRVLRLGQSKPVCVIRYITQKTIEESVRSRQIMKIQLALKGGLQSSDKKSVKLSSLQELSKIIESTVLTQVLTAIPQGIKE